MVNTNAAVFANARPSQQAKVLGKARPVVETNHLTVRVDSAVQLSAMRRGITASVVETASIIAENIKESVYFFAPQTN